MGSFQNDVGENIIINEQEKSSLELIVEQIMDVAFEEAKKDFPELEADLIIFETTNTDSIFCGQNSITSISACAVGNAAEVFVRINQLFGYLNEFDAALYAVPHEVGHVIQGSLGLLDDYVENQAFRELQSDCIAGHYFKTLDPTDRQIERQIILMSNIGDLGTHGSAEDRVKFWNIGLEQGVDKCIEMKP